MGGHLAGSVSFNGSEIQINEILNISTNGVNFIKDSVSTMFDLDNLLNPDPIINILYNSSTKKLTLDYPVLYNAKSDLIPDAGGIYSIRICAKKIW